MNDHKIIYENVEEILSYADQAYLTLLTFIVIVTFTLFIRNYRQQNLQNEIREERNELRKLRKNIRSNISLLRIYYDKTIPHIVSSTQGYDSLHELSHQLNVANHKSELAMEIYQQRKMKDSDRQFVIKKYAEIKSRLYIWSDILKAFSERKSNGVRFDDLNTMELKSLLAYSGDSPSIEVHESKAFLAVACSEGPYDQGSFSKQCTDLDMAISRLERFRERKQYSSIEEHVPDYTESMKETHDTLRESLSSSRDSVIKAINLMEEKKFPTCNDIEEEISRLEKKIHDNQKQISTDMTIPGINIPVRIDSIIFVVPIIISLMLIIILFNLQNGFEELSSINELDSSMVKLIDGWFWSVAYQSFEWKYPYVTIIIALVYIVALPLAVLFQASITVIRDGKKVLYHPSYLISIPIGIYTTIGIFYQLFQLRMLIMNH